MNGRIEREKEKGKTEQNEITIFSFLQKTKKLDKTRMKREGGGLNMGKAIEKKATRKS